MHLDVRLVDGSSDAASALLGLVLAVTLGVGLISLSGCESPAAQRERARMERTLAEAQAYEQRKQADTAAYAEQMAIREAAKEARHQRTMEALPYTAIIAVSLAVMGVSVCLTYHPVARHPERMTLLGDGPSKMTNPARHHVTNVFILSSQFPSERRADYWRRVEAAVPGQPWTMEE